MKLGKREAIFLFCYILCIAVALVFREVYNKTRVLWLSYIILTVTVYCTLAIRSKLSRRDLIVRFAIISLFSVASIISNKPEMMMYAALMCTSELTSFRRICRVCFLTCGIVVFLVFIADLLGIVPTRVFYRGTRIYSFGFGYYNTVPYVFFFMVLEYFYYKSTYHKEVAWIGLVIILVINYILYKMTTLRLVFYLVCIVLVLYILLVKFKLFNLKSKPMVILSTLIFPVFFSLSVWLYHSYTKTSTFFVKMDRLLSERLSLGKQALSKYSINLFGNRIETFKTANEYFYVDSGFLYSLLGYGLLFSGMALLIYILLCKHAAKMNDKVLLIWLIAVAIFSVINNTWISIYINPVLLYFPILLKKKNMDMEQIWDQNLYRRKRRIRLIR